MIKEYQEALGLIEEYKNIIILRHLNPDGDAIGSQIGLKRIINSNFPDKNVFVTGDSLARYSFMYKEGMDNIPDSLFKESLSIVLDTSSPNLISDERYKMSNMSLRFDHHIFIKKICSVEVVDTSFVSCSSLIADFAYKMGLEIDRSAAESLFTGLVTDSGRFLYDSVNPRTFLIASSLLSTGIKTSSIYSSLYNEDFSALKRRGYYIDKIKLTTNNVAYTYITKEDLKIMDAEAFSVSRGLVNTMANIRGVGIWVSFTEDEESFLCEIRSNNTNINKIAVKYGGGGHEKASGATLESKEEALLLLDDLNLLAGEND